MLWFLTLIRLERTDPVVLHLTISFANGSVPGPNSVGVTNISGHLFNVISTRLKLCHFFFHACKPKLMSY